MPTMDTDTKFASRCRFVGSSPQVVKSLLTRLSVLTSLAETWFLWRLTFFYRTCPRNRYLRLERSSELTEEDMLACLALRGSQVKSTIVWVRGAA
jgi:hypothetical protein